MEMIGNKWIKDRTDHKVHFLERVKLRYGIDIPGHLYDDACKAFCGKFKRSAYKTVGYIRWAEQTIWCLYYNEQNCLATAYPAQVETDMRELIRACFAPPIRPVALLVYQKYVEEAQSLTMPFETIKEAAIYYFDNTLFPPLHIDMYKHGNVDIFKVVHHISNILLGKSLYVQLSIEKKPKL